MIAKHHTIENMFEKVCRFIESQQLLEPHDRVLMAVSGGIDSMVLLDVVCRLQEKYELKLHVAHLDHRLRPESPEDSAFVAERAKSLQLPCTVESRNVNALSKTIKTSLEAAARQARYAFLQRVATLERCNKIALGHNKNDQVETFFLNLIRGAGLQGLSGMRPKDRRYARPLLDCSRAEIETYARARNIEYREDSSNQDLRFRRNWVRHRLLPSVEEINPNLIETLARNQAIFGQANDYLIEQAQDAFETALLSRSDAEIVLERSALKKLHPALLSTVIRITIGHLVGTLNRLSEHHIGTVVEHVDQAYSGQQLELPLGTSVWVHAKTLQFVKVRSEEKCPTVSLCVPGQTRWGAWTFTSQVVGKEHRQAVKSTRNETDHLSARLDWSTIGQPLTVRSRRPGDRIDPIGLQGQKKIQDILVDGKVPRTKRDEIPVLQDRQGIVWVVTQCQSERTKLTNATNRILEITAVKNTSTCIKRGNHD